jgi:arginase
MQPTPKTIAIVGAPIEAGTNLGGALMGPAALRTAGLARTLARLGHVVDDRGDLAIARERGSTSPAPPLEGPRNIAEIAAWTTSLGASVHAILESGAFPVVLGGDHSLSLGSIDGVSRFCQAAGRELFVLWLDAHADFNTPETSLSGNVHGMPLAALCGEPGLEAVLRGPRRVDPANVSLFGIRSLDDGERALLEARAIDVVDMRSIDEFGVVAPLRRILRRVAAADGFLHVSFDVDFLDPSIAPGVGTTVPGGATFREAHLIMELLHDSGLVASLDVVELNPFLDDRGKSALALVELVASLFGRRIIERPTRAPSLA